MCASALSVVVAVLVAVSGSSMAVTQGHVVCYYASWAHYRQGPAKYSLDDVPVDLCTHVVYAFAVLDSERLVAKMHDPWLDKDLNNYKNFVQLKQKKPGLKLLLGLGGWNDSRSTKYSRLVSNPMARRTMVEAVVKLLLEYGFDGLDLDWEYPGYEEGRPSDKQGFVTWIRELREAFRPHGLLLTAAVSAGRSTIDKGYDVPTVAKLLDMVILMSYDFHGSWENNVWHHAPLKADPGMSTELTVDFAVKYWIKKGAPPHKLVMGTPSYGRSWTLAGSNNAPGAPAAGAGREGRHVRERGSLPYFEACLGHQKEGWTKWRTGAGPYITKGNQWVGYDDVESIVVKAQYARDLGLGGVMMWDLSTDDFKNICGGGKYPLLTALSNTFRGQSVPSNAITSPPSGGTSTTQLWPPTTQDSHTGTFGGLWGGSSSGSSSGAGVASSGGLSGGVDDGELAYPWLAWPVFSRSPEDVQHFNALAQTTTIRPITTPRTTRPTTRPTIRPTTPRTHQGSWGSLTEGQTNKLAYAWQSWPVFSRSPEDVQRFNALAQTTTIRPYTTPRTTRPTTPRTHQGSGAGITGGQTNQLAYAWQAWPVFSRSPEDVQRFSAFAQTTPIRPSTTPTRPTTPPTRQGSGNGVTGGQTTKLAYPWQAWPIFSRSDNDIRPTSVSLSSSSFLSSGSSSPSSSSSVSSSFPGSSSLSSSSSFGRPPSSFSGSSSLSSSSSFTGSSSLSSSPSFGKPQSSLFSGTSSLSSSSSGITWFRDCKEEGLAPDPNSCAAFYKCTASYAYRFSCPDELLWNQDAGACDWPASVQCVLPLNPPDITPFLRPKIN